MIAILDYGVGNLRSIYNIFKNVGVESVITSDTETILRAEKYILPGVGSFDHGITSLRNAPFFEVLEREVLVKKKPILGICLGMQLLTKSSEEGKELGLGWIDARTLRLNVLDTNLPVPHMGWNRVSTKVVSEIFHGLEENRFYFVHSYHVVCDDKDEILATSDYSSEFTCAVHKDNILGVQFHPEKSHKFGMRLLKNFGEM